jgi:uncharacterized lipoprotein
MSKNESLEDKIFEKHYNNYRKMPVETIKQQAGQVEQVSKDYQGRVVYELLQNAFDKADKDILIKLTDDYLYVANDGNQFTYEYDYDYDDGKSKNRGDFHSMCSISTSSKLADKNIGNKGVGFKSVFSIARNEKVSVFTVGKIIQNGITEKDREPISFEL